MSHRGVSTTSTWSAARLGELLDGVADGEVLDGALAAVFESDTPEEMLRRVSSIRRPVRSGGR